MELSRSGRRRERKSAQMAGRSVRLKRKARRARLIRSFSQNRHGEGLGLSGGLVMAAPLALTPDDLFDHVDRLSVHFVVDPGHHLTEQAHAYQLNAEKHEEDRQQKKRAPAYLLGREQLEAYQVQQEGASYRPHRDPQHAQDLDRFGHEAQEEFYSYQVQEDSDRSRDGVF